MCSPSTRLQPTAAQTFFSLQDVHEILLRFLIGPQQYDVAWSTLAKLGRTCKGISDAALNVLWEKLYTLDPLFRLLPNDAYETAKMAGNVKYQVVFISCLTI